MGIIDFVDCLMSKSQNKRLDGKQKSRRLGRLFQ